MPNPTVWAVTDPSGRGIAIAGDAGDALYRAERTGDVPLPVMRDLWGVYVNGTRRDAFAHAGYRVAPMALVVPEALAVVEAACAYRDTLYDALDKGASDVAENVLDDAVRAYRAATARDDKGGA